MSVQTIDVRELLEHPGTSRSIHLREPLSGLHTELVDVPEERPVEGDLLLEGVVEGVYVQGSLGAEVEMRCARCLKPFAQRVEVEVAELVPRDPGPDDDYAIGPELTIDPEPLVRDAVALELPFAPLCSPTCQGLCPRCGGDRNLLECSCTEGIDPRWAALDGLEGLIEDQG